MTEDIQYDEAELERINERLFVINNYKKKYGGSVEAVIENFNDLKKKHEELIHAEEIIKREFSSFRNENNWRKNK